MLQFIADMLKSYLTLKLTFWPGGSSKITKILPEKDFSGKITRKKRYYTCFQLYLFEIIFLLTWPWNWGNDLDTTFYHQNSNTMNYSVKMTSKQRTTLILLFVFAKNHISHFLPWNWLLYDLELKLTLHMSLTPQNITLNGFSSKKRYYTFS